MPEPVKGRGTSPRRISFEQAEADMGITHRDGVRWHEAPLPGRFHRCQVQTEGTLGGPFGDLYQRCACGAIRRNNHGWMERNSRRKGR